MAIRITDAVGTMVCAYVFAALAFISLPDAIKHGRATIISWIAQTFLQLVLLSIILVGQKVMSQKAADHQESLNSLHEKHDFLHSHLLSKKKQDS